MGYTVDFSEKELLAVHKAIMDSRGLIDLARMNRIKGGVEYCTLHEELRSGDNSHYETMGELMERTHAIAFDNGLTDIEPWYDI